MPSSSLPRRVDEHGLGAFRARYLAPDALLQLVEEYVRALANLGVGVGKSHAIDALLVAALTYARFDLVIYAAPSWDVINERTVVRGDAEPPVEWRVVKPRPSGACGSYRDTWADLEKRGCVVHAKATLCRECQEGVPEAARCFWPTQLNELKGVRLLFLTEKQILLNPALVTVLKQKTGAKRVLVVLDEAQFLEGSFETVIEPDELRRFQDVLASLAERSDRAAKDLRPWVNEIDDLLSMPSADLAGGKFEFPSFVLRRSGEIQREGLRRYRSDFRFLGYDLVQLGSSSAGERWKDPDGRVRFVARPYLTCHALVFSAHLTAEFVGHRLGCGTIASPFEDTVVRHSGSRVLNIRNSIGAETYFARNIDSILDVFASLILRNIAEGRSTLLVSRKKLKARCAEYLTRRLAEWGVDVRFVTDRYQDLPAHPDPRIVPIVHYGIRGVNDFAEYDSAYCVNSYYVSSTTLERQVYEAEPEEFRARIEVRLSRRDRIRRARAVLPDSDPGLSELAAMYLRKLEVDPAIQAVGRVRFLTRPREVVLFQTNDLSQDIGEVEDVRSPSALLERLGAPTPRQLDRWALGQRARHLMAEGASADEVAKTLGVSRRTVFNHLREVQSAKTPPYILLRGRFCTEHMHARDRGGES